MHGISFCIKSARLRRSLIPQSSQWSCSRQSKVLRGFLGRNVPVRWRAATVSRGRQRLVRHGSQSAWLLSREPSVTVIATAEYEPGP